MRGNQGIESNYANRIKIYRFPIKKHVFSLSTLVQRDTNLSAKSSSRHGIGWTVGRPSPRHQTIEGQQDSSAGLRFVEKANNMNLRM